MRRGYAIGLLVLLMAAALLPTAVFGQTSAAKDEPVGPVEVSGAVYSDVSPPLSDMTGLAPAAPDEKEKKEKPLKVLPNMGNALNQEDGAVQTAVGPLAGDHQRPELRGRRPGRLRLQRPVRAARHGRRGRRHPVRAVGQHLFCRVRQVARAPLPRASPSRATRPGPVSAAAARRTTTATPSCSTTSSPTAGS